MWNNQKIPEGWSVKIMRILKNIFGMFFTAVLFFIILFLTLEEVNVWPFMVFSIFIIFLFNIKIFVQNFEIFKIGKDGVELKRITKDAQNATEELKKIASLFSKNMAETITRLGRWDSYFTTKELYENRIEMRKLLSSINIDKSEIEKNLQTIDNFIIFDALGTISNRYNGSNKVELSKKISSLISGPQEKQYYPDIHGIKKCLIEQNELDDINSRILSEVQYYQENNIFKTNDFLIFIEEIRNARK